MPEIFEIPVRVYFQDTDAGGVVFHATYLDFMERARIEWLRARGFEPAKLAGQFRLLFIVRRMQASYAAPALLDDLLQVSAQVALLGRAQITFAQTVRRQDEVLVRAMVNVGCVGSEGWRPMAIPEPIRRVLEPEVSGPSSERFRRTPTPSAPPLSLSNRIGQT